MSRFCLLFLCLHLFRAVLRYRLVVSVFYWWSFYVLLQVNRLLHSSIICRSQTEI